MGLKARIASPWETTVPADRIDWPSIRERIDLGHRRDRLTWPGPGRRGERGRRLWWPCPLHDDKNPSFAIDAGKAWWRCYGCGEHGDAANLVMRLQGVTFPEAVRWLAEQVGILPPSGKPTRPRPPAASPPANAPEQPARQASGLPLADALKLVEDAAARLWTPEGADALAYLRGRGLTEATIKTARLGWTPEVTLPTADGVRFWRASGVVIPWLDGDRLCLVKIRQPEGKRPKYVEAYRDRPAMFPAPSVVRPGKPLVVVEGEFDCLLLAQELADLAAVVTLGTCIGPPRGIDLLAMLSAPTWSLAHDADDAGDKAASGWPARAIRVRPPLGKDWTDAHLAAIDLRRWWIEQEFADEFDREERAAVMEFDGGLTREAAERAAGLTSH